MSLDNKTTNTFAKECTHLTIRELISESYIWNSFVQTAPSSCFMQAWDWADFKELEEYKTFRYGLFLNKELVGECIFYLYPNSSKTNLLIAPGGPILSTKYPEEGMQLLLKKASLIVKKMGAIALRIEPLWTQKSNYPLHWAAMQRAKTRGCQFYDFYGFTRDLHHVYAKFSQFKSQFGGMPITTIGAHDYFFYDQLADTLINLFQSLTEKK